MSTSSNTIVLPYEHDATAHWEAARRRKEVRAWLKERQRVIDSPPTAPERPTAPEKGRAEKGRA